jgi:hypothetical protein
MSDHLNNAQRYHAAIHQILMSRWDPIGVRNVPEAQDEYDAYVTGIYGRLIHRAARHELLDYLWWVETEHMGLRGDRQRAESVVDELLEIGRKS